MAERVAGLKVIISGDVSQLQRSIRTANTSMDTLGVSTRKASKAADEHVHLTERMRTGFGTLWARGGAGIAAIVGFEGLKKGLESVTEAYQEQEGANTRLRAQFKANGKSFEEFSGRIEETVKHVSGLSGIAAPQLTDAFTNLFRATGNVRRSIDLVGTAADIARAKHMDAAKAAQLLGKVADGNVSAFSRYGVAIDKGATASQALAKIQRTFAGQAAAYGKTSAGASDRLRASLEELRASIGAKIVPIIGRLVGKLADFVNGMQEGTGAGGKFVKWVGNAADAIRKWVDDNIIPVIRKLTPFFKGTFQNLIQEAKGLIEFISGVFSGNWGRAWRGIKDLVAGAAKQMLNIIVNLGPLLLKAALNVGKAIVTGILKGLEGLAGALANKVKSAVSSIPGAISGAAKSVGKALISPFGDGVGKSFSDSTLPAAITGGAFSGSLMGARPIMGTFAREGARFGLSVSSGRRPGSITSSGNVSWHSTGEAIDLSNGYATPQELAFAKYEVSRHGSQLAELIHTPLGFGIKNGQRVPLSFWGPAINAQHMNHVHVAYDSGRPGIGDGTGRARRNWGDGIGQIESLWMQAGGPRSRAALAAAVAMAESSGNPGASHVNSNGTVDRGLWQINSIHGSQSTFDRGGNARAAVAISSHGANWSPWTTYTSGAYRRFLSAAQAALGGAGSRGGGGGSSSGPALSPSQIRAGNRRQAGASTGLALSTATHQAVLQNQSQAGRARSAEHYGNLVGDLNLPVRLRGSDTDILDAAAALAGTTKGTADDIAAANDAVKYWKTQLRKAKRSGKASKITAALSGLSNARSTLHDLRHPNTTDTGAGSDDSSLVDAINNLAALEQQRIELQTEANANQAKLLTLAQTQPGQMMAAIVAAVNGGIGGRVGLGFQSVGYAGQVART